MKTVTKQAQGQAVQGMETAGLPEQELAAINRLSRGNLSGEEVYCFPVRLCDNQTDRDDEYFDRRGLELLAELFVGKTGIFDHSWSARDQTARLYRTEIVEEPGAVSEAGEPGCYLKGYAYMLRTQENAGLIAEIEGGIKKEVSVGCAVRRTVCSVCGQDLNDRDACAHVKGRWYGSQLCYGTLSEPTDAFEWSFVAVPAQPRAGVVKSSQVRLKEFLKGRPDCLEELAGLEKEAELGRRYLGRLRRKVARLAGMAELNISASTLRGIVDKLEEPELVELAKAYESRLEELYPPAVQLETAAGTNAGTGADPAFLI